MTQEEIRFALEQNDKKSRKALARLAADLETDDPETYRAILQRQDWQGDALAACRAYRKTYILSRVALILAALVVIASYITGDFGMQLFTSWLNRYILAIGITVAMSLFAGSALLVNYHKDRFLAHALLQE